MVGSLDRILIVCHALRLMCVRSVEVMTSSQLFFGVGSRTDISNIFELFDDVNMRSGFYPFFHIALLNDFGIVWFDSVHRSTASLSLSVEVYPQSVLWLLKSPITI